MKLFNTLGLSVVVLPHSPTKAAVWLLCRAGSHQGHIETDHLFHRDPASYSNQRLYSLKVHHWQERFSKQQVNSHQVHRLAAVFNANLWSFALKYSWGLQLLGNKPNSHRDQTNNPLWSQHLWRYFDTLWSIMLGQADCTKPADRQLIQTGTNDDWHFKQSVWAANSTFFPVVPSCSMLLQLLLMKCCAAFSVHQHSLLLCLFYQCTVRSRAMSTVYIPYCTSRYCCVVLCLEGRAEAIVPMFSAFHNPASSFKLKYPDAPPLSLGYCIGGISCSNGRTSWENLKGEWDEKEIPLFLTKLLPES